MGGASDNMPPGTLGAASDNMPPGTLGAASDSILPRTMRAAPDNMAPGSKCTKGNTLKLTRNDGSIEVSEIAITEGKEKKRNGDPQTYSAQLNIFDLKFDMTFFKLFCILNSKIAEK